MIRWNRRKTILTRLIKLLEGMNTAELENAYFKLTGDFLEK